MAIRSARREDVPALTGVVNRAFAHEEWLIPGPRVTEPALLADLDASGTVLLLAAQGDRILAAVRVSPHKDGERVAEMGLLSVDPEAQGTGIGTRLVAAAEDWARSEGHRRMRLRCGVELGLATYYSRLGYRAVLEDVGAHFNARRPFTLVTMEKDLADPKAARRAGGSATHARPRPFMDLTHLRYFLAIARCGSMTAAGRALGVSQPNLTMSVRHLEEQLGTSLFHRERTGVRLTESGQELLGHATDILARVDAAERRIRSLEADDVGHFVLGCHESLGAYFLPGFLQHLLAELPRIDIALWNGPSPAVQRAVLDRDVHFGLVVRPELHPELVIIELFHDVFEVVVRADGTGAEDDLDAACARLRAGPLVHAGRVGQSRQLMEQLEVQGLLPRRVLSCGDLALVKSIALAGIGAALLPRRVASSGQAGQLRPLHPALPTLVDAIALVYRADFHRTAAATRLKEALVAHGRSLDATLPT